MMMAEKTAAGSDEHVIAEGVDEEPVEKNRRLFTGPSFVFIATLSKSRG